jgi:hypothetical protein
MFLYDMDQIVHPLLSTTQFILPYYTRSTVIKKEYDQNEIVTYIHPNNMNTKLGISLNMSWKPLIHTMKKQKKALAKNRS